MNLKNPEDFDRFSELVSYLVPQYPDRVEIFHLFKILLEQENIRPGNIGINRENYETKLSSAVKKMFCGGTFTKKEIFLIQEFITSQVNITEFFLMSLLLGALLKGDQLDSPSKLILEFLLHQNNIGEISGLKHLLLPLDRTR